jgi:glycosyltransferase involved in cell wall biosynthesis
MFKRAGALEHSILHINLASALGGGEFQTLHLIKGLAKYPIRQQILVRGGGPLAAMLAKANLPITIHSTNTIFSGIWRYQLATFRGLLHVHDGRGVHWAALHAKLWRSTFVLTRRINHPIRQKKTTLAHYARATHCIAISHSIEEKLKQFHPIPTSVIPSAYLGLSKNEACIHKLRQRFSGKFVIVQTGNFLACKGHCYTIEVARRLQHKHPDIIFLFLGQGPLQQALEVQAAGLNHIFFEGFVDNVGDYLSIADVLIMPSLEEGLGSAILDAQSFSVPVVASRVGGIPDVIRHNETGLLCSPRDVEALTDAVCLLYANKDLRARLVSQADRALENYSVDRMCQRYYKLYQSIWG